MKRPWHPSNMLRPSKTLRPAAPSSTRIPEKELESIASRSIEQNIRQYKVGRNQIRSGRAQEPAAAETSEAENAINKRSARKQIKAERQFENSVKDASAAVAQAAAKSVNEQKEAYAGRYRERSAPPSARVLAHHPFVPHGLRRRERHACQLRRADSIHSAQRRRRHHAGGVPLLRGGGDYQDSETDENKRFKGGVFSMKPSSTIPRGCSWTCVRSLQTGSTKIRRRMFLTIFRCRRQIRRSLLGRRSGVFDLFERGSPGCFGDPDHTLADLCMKSEMLIIANRQASLQQRSDTSAVPR